MAGSFTLLGAAAMRARQKRANQVATAAMEKWTYQLSKIVLKDAQAIVPYKTGELHDSGKARKPKKDSDGGISAEILFTARHALIQHERLDYHHNRGEAKYLEKALIKGAANGNAFLASGIRGELSDFID